MEDNDKALMDRLEITWENITISTPCPFCHHICMLRIPFYENKTNIVDEDAF